MHAVTERGKEAWYTLSVSFADSSPKGRAKAPAGAGSHPHKFQSFAEPTGRGAQWRQYVMPTFVTNCLQAQPGRGAQGQLYLVPNVRNALAAGLARQIPSCRFVYKLHKFFQLSPKGIPSLSIINCQFRNLLLTHTTKTFPRICEKVFSARESLTASAARA